MLKPFVVFVYRSYFRREMTQIGQSRKLVVSEKQLGGPFVAFVLIEAFDLIWMRIRSECWFWKTLLVVD